MYRVGRSPTATRGARCSGKMRGSVVECPVASRGVYRFRAGYFIGSTLFLSTSLVRSFFVLVRDGDGIKSSARFRAPPAPPGTRRGAALALAPAEMPGGKIVVEFPSMKGGVFWSTQLFVPFHMLYAL